MTWLSIVAVVLVVGAMLARYRLALAGRPRIFPSVFFLFSRALGVVGAVYNAFGSERYGNKQFCQRLRAVDFASCRRFRDAFAELDRLPTISRGNQALGYRSLIEAQVRRDFSTRPSPFSHPLQRPYVYLPGVPARAFYDESLPWIKPLEAGYPIVKEELAALLNEGGTGFKKYRSEGGDVSETWNTFNLFIQGERVADNCARVPRTVALLESLPRLERHHIMFSALNPASHIPPHVGVMNGILRGHLPLIVPGGCSIRVGDEERGWEEGKVLVFDDSFVHQAWNRSNGLRVVLFINFWHPCFTEDEIAVLERFRATIDGVSAMSLMWKQYQQEPRTHTIALEPALMPDT